MNPCNDIDMPQSDLPVNLKEIARRIAVDLEPPVAPPVPHAVWNRPKATEMVLEQLAPLITRINDVLSQADEAIDRAMGFASPREMELEDDSICSSRRAQASYDRMVDYVNEVCGKIHQLKEEISRVQS